MNVARAAEARINLDVPQLEELLGGLHVSTTVRFWKTRHPCAHAVPRAHRAHRGASHVERPDGKAWLPSGLSAFKEQERPPAPSIYTDQATASLLGSERVDR